MSSVGLHNLLFSGFFPSESARSGLRAGGASTLFDGEQLLPPAADFATLVRSALFDQEPSRPFDVEKFFTEEAESLVALAAFVSDLFGKEIRLEPMGGTEVFRIHRMMGEGQAVPKHFPSMDETGTPVPRTETEVGLLLVGETILFSVDPKAPIGEIADRPARTLILVSTEDNPPIPILKDIVSKPVDLTLSLPVSGEPRDSIQHPVGRQAILLVASGEEIRIPPPTKAPEAAAIRDLPSTVKANPVSVQSLASEATTNDADNRPNDKPVDFAHQPAPTAPVLHPALVEAVRVALDLATEEVAKTAGPQILKPHLTEARGEQFTDTNLERSVRKQFDENPVLPVRGLPLEASVRTPEAASPLATALRLVEHPAPNAPAPSTLHPTESRTPLNLEKTPAPEKPAETPNFKSPAIPPHQTPPPEPVRTLPVRIHLVRGEVAEKLEDLAGRILETRSTSSRGVAPPIAQPILTGTSWNPLTARSDLFGPLAPSPEGTPLRAPEVEPGRNPETKTTIPTAKTALPEGVQPHRSTVTPTSAGAIDTPPPSQDEPTRKTAPESPVLPVKETKPPLDLTTRPEPGIREESPEPKRAFRAESESPTPNRQPPSNSRGSGVEIAPVQPTRLTSMEGPSNPVAEKPQAPVSGLIVTAPVAPRAAAPLAEPLPSAPLAVENEAVDQIARTLRSRSLAQGSEVRIRLVPESLGEIHLKVTVRNGQIVAEIRANSEGTRALLSRNTTQLQSLLAEGGAGIEKVVVRTGAFGSDLQNASSLSRDPSPESDPREGREKPSKEREEHPSQNRDQSRGNKRRTLWDRFL